MDGSAADTCCFISGHDGRGRGGVAVTRPTIFDDDDRNVDADDPTSSSSSSLLMHPSPSPAAVADAVAAQDYDADAATPLAHFVAPPPPVGGAIKEAAAPASSEAATTPKPAPPSPPPPATTLSAASARNNSHRHRHQLLLLQSVERSLGNVGHALSCSICRSTPSGGDSAVLLAECVHLFCPPCIALAFRDQQIQQQKQQRHRSNSSSSSSTLHCPVCRQPATRRSAFDAPDNYQKATAAYKRLLQAFGLSPMVYAPHLCMTQVPVPVQQGNSRSFGSSASSAGSGSEDNDNEEQGDNGASPGDEEDQEDAARANYQMSILFAEHYRTRERARQLQSVAAAATASSAPLLGAAAAETALREEQDEIVRINREYYQRQLKKKKKSGRTREQQPDTSPAHGFAAEGHPYEGGVATTQDSCLANDAQDQFAADAAWEEHCRTLEQERQDQAEDSQKQNAPKQERREETTTLNLQLGGGDIGFVDGDIVCGRPRETECLFEDDAGAARIVQTPASGLGGGGNPEMTGVRGGGRGLDDRGGDKDDVLDQAPDVPQLHGRNLESAPADATDSLLVSDAVPPTSLMSSQITPHTDHRCRVRPEPEQYRPAVDGAAVDSEGGGVDVGGGTSLTMIEGHVTPYLRPKDGDAGGNAASSGGENDPGSNVAKANAQALPVDEKDVRPIETLDASNGTDRPSFAASVPQMEDSSRNFTDDDANDANLPVGTVVNVAPRTWPGMNKPGGVARITKIHRMSETGEVSYSVQYVLGGTESRVDAVFVTRYKDDDMGTTTTAGSREAGRAASRRTGASPSQHRKSIRLEQHTAAEWSPSLLEQLAKEGFDVTAAAGPKLKTVSSTSTRKRPGSIAAPTDNPRAKKLRRIGASIADFVRRRLPRTGQRAGASSGHDGGSRKENEPANELAKTPPPTPPPLPAYSPAECCRRADVSYNRRVTDAMSKGCIYVAASSLTDESNKVLDRVCRETKSSKVQVKRVERIDAKKTTFCLIPAGDEPSASDDVDFGTDLTACKRTIKAMQATLAGVPLVSSSWLQLCQGRQDVSAPLSTMWIRSLPCSSTYTANGVARLAAHLHDDSTYRPLAGLAVHYCGTIPRQKEADMTLLLREAGAALILNTGSLHSHLIRSASQRSVVLVCGGSVKLSVPLEAKIRQMPAGTVQVVHSSWVFDCISCGQALGPSAYEPVESGSQARELWKLTSSPS